MAVQRGPTPAHILLHTPDAWRMHLLEDVDDKDRLCLLSTCTALRTCVLQSCKNARCALELNTPEQKFTSMALGLARAHTLRGQLPTEVVLQQRVTSPTMARQALQVLKARTGTHVHWLTPAFLSLYRPPQANSLLAATAQCMPNLRRLTLDGPNLLLPPPGKLRHLTHLAVCHDPNQHVAYTAAVSSTAPFLTQLKTLELHHSELQQYPNLKWDQLFTKPSTTLDTFITDQRLDDTLLGHLINNTPALKHLQVLYLCVDLDVWADKVWALEQLHVEWDGLQLDMVARMPQSRKHLTVALDGFDTAAVKCDLDPKLGLAGDMLQRLANVTVKDIVEVQLLGNPDNPQPTEPAALTTAIHQVSTLDVQQPAPWRVRLQHLIWTPALAGALATAVVAHPALTLRVNVAELSDSTLDTLMQHGPRAGYQLTVHDVLMERERNRERPWPWELVRVSQPLSVKKLLCFPDPQEETRRVEMREHIPLRFDLTLEDVAAGMVEKLVARLQHMEFSAAAMLAIEVVPPEQASVTQQPALLRANLEVLRAVRLAEGQQQAHMRLSLQAWTVTTRVMAELSGLPHWECDLGLCGLTWLFLDLDDKPYTAMASHIPSSYPVWNFHGVPGGHEQLVHICMGVKEHRKGEGKLQIFLAGIPSEEYLDALELALTEQELDEHLEIEHRPDAPVEDFED